MIHETHDELESEIKRLRERLHTVETENAAMSVKLSQQQWEVDQRYENILSKAYIYSNLIIKIHKHFFSKVFFI